MKNEKWKMDLMLQANPH